MTLDINQYNPQVEQMHSPTSRNNTRNREESEGMGKAVVRTFTF